MLFYQTEDAVDFVHELINFNPLKWYVTVPQSMSDSLPRTTTIIFCACTNICRKTQDFIRSAEVL